MKRGRKFVMIVSVVVLLLALWIAFCGYQWSWGPFGKLHDLKTANLPGNDLQYSPEEVQPVEDSPLSGKHILFLGSSVTYGAASKGVSFADYIAVRNGCSITKEAVSSTTLVDNGNSSYISRIKNWIVLCLLTCLYANSPLMMHRKRNLLALYQRTAIMIHPLWPAQSNSLLTMPARHGTVR